MIFDTRCVYIYIQYTFSRMIQNDTSTNPSYHTIQCPVTSPLPPLPSHAPTPTALHWNSWDSSPEAPRRFAATRSERRAAWKASPRSSPEAALWPGERGTGMEGCGRTSAWPTGRRELRRCESPMVERRIVYAFSSTSFCKKTSLRSYRVMFRLTNGVLGYIEPLLSHTYIPFLLWSSVAY